MLNNQDNVKTPWHLYIVAVVGVLWNSGGGFDYYMTQTKSADYMAQFTPAQLEFFYAMPTFIVCCWAIAVWGGVLGCLLLLLQKKWAAPVLLLSWICMTITAVRNYVFSNGMEVIGDPISLAFTATIFIIAGLLAWYAHSLNKAGVLS
ncbi:hypothetical protein HER31_10690 [Ferrimonas lipolytica]|uniref:Uncharacterized protein n=1 Tax=Ferrimonas lipolytica TaxID=2724191 RepID=A0A6H1UJS7_9GAMM|nr:hypothetical protein HER31_10690 [Ferrimonas lipolytica]